jgi:formylglycine-generating enzyme required for sulfatase activity
MWHKLNRMILAVAIVLTAATSQAITIETVPVGDPGNAGELSGSSVFNGAGDDRICGAVGYTYQIGKYEVTTGQYCAFLNAVARTDTYGLYNTGMLSGCKIQQSGASGNYTYSFETDYANRPVNCVSWGNATRFANWLHNGQPTGNQSLSTTEDGAYYLNGSTTDDALMAVSREADWKWAVTSEDEWYKAAYYKGGGTNAGYWKYPTRSNTEPGRDMADVSGNNANWHFSSGTYPIDSGKYTTLGGEFQNSASPYGTFDQGGNVWEWNESIESSFRGLRGGSFDSGPGYLNACCRWYSLNPSFRSYNAIGFRVVSAVPEPGSITLFFTGIACLLAYAWRRRK